ncbi:MAG: linear amide C-N hydrolase [bacterium]
MSLIRITVLLILITSRFILFAQDNSNLTSIEQYNYNCTIIAGVSDGKILVGNNEDYTEPNTSIFIYPSKDGEYGRILFGFTFGEDNYGYCGGVNEAGLFMDGNGISNTGWKADPSKDWIRGNLESQILAKYATVEQVIEVFTKYNIPQLQTGKWLIADKTGASVVIEWGQDKLQILKREGSYQISTNFVQSNYPKDNYPDFRYNLAEKIFKSSENNISVELIRKILAATHWEDEYSYTLYSYICDMQTGDVCVYNFHNYEEALKLNIHEEMNKGERRYSLASLFPYQTMAERRFKNLCERKNKEKTKAEFYAAQFKELCKNGSVSGTKEYVEKIIKEWTDMPAESRLNDIGYNLLGQGKDENALALFRIIAELFPYSANAYDSLGEAYMKAGENELAIENYRKSLELNPDNENAKQVLRQQKK